jgi:hypothetical protein
MARTGETENLDASFFVEIFVAENGLFVMVKSWMDVILVERSSTIECYHQPSPPKK